MAKQRKLVKTTCGVCLKEVQYLTGKGKDEVIIGCECGIYKREITNTPYMPPPSKEKKDNPRRVKIGKIWID